MCSRYVAVFASRRLPEVVGGPSYGLRHVQQFDHMFGIRTHYRLLFEQVIDRKPTGGPHMMPIETISPRASIRVRPVQVRPASRGGRPGSRGPQPSRPVASPPRYRGTGVLMSTVSHRPRPITPATTVALALVAAGITVWLGFVAHFGGMLHAGPEKAAVQMPDRLAVVRVEPGRRCSTWPHASPRMRRPVRSPPKSANSMSSRRLL